MGFGGFKGFGFRHLIVLKLEGFNSGFGVLFGFSFCVLWVWRVWLRV